MDFLIIFLTIILNFGHLVANGPFSSEENCSADGTSDSEFWAWTRQQSELFNEEDKQDDGIVQQFLEDLEQEEQQLLFPPPVIHPITEKYTHQKFEPEVNRSFRMETNDDDKQSKAKKDTRKWYKSFKRIGNNFEKNIPIKMENEQNKSKTILISGQKETVENLLQNLRCDVNLFKRLAFFGGQRDVKISSLFSGIKHRMNLAIDLLAGQFGINQIVPAKIPLTNRKILKILAINWMKMRKLKNEQKKGPNGYGEKKQKKFVEELLKMIKGLLDGPQFEMLTNNGLRAAANNSQKKRRRRRGTNVGLIIAIVAGVFCLLILGVTLVVWINQKKGAEPANAPPSGSTTSSSSPFEHTCGRTD